MMPAMTVQSWLISTLLLSAISALPFFYTQDNMFTSYQFRPVPTMDILFSDDYNESYISVPGRPYFNISQYGMVLAGMENNQTTYSGYSFIITSDNPLNISYFQIELTIANGSIFNQLTFCIYMISNQALPYFTAIQTYLTNMPSLQPSAAANTPSTYVTGNILGPAYINQAYQVYLKQFYSISPVSYSKFSVKVSAANSGGNNYKLTISTKKNIDLVFIRVVTLIFNNSQISLDSKKLFQIGTNTAVTANFGINAYYGPNFSQKCIFGYNFLQYDSLSSLMFDMTTSSGILLQNNTAFTSISIKTFCLIDMYYCNESMANCTSCTDEYNCDTCNNTFFLNATVKCELCSVYLMGCLNCDNQTFCTSCDEPTYYTTSIGFCLNCTQYIAFCGVCTNILSCTVCIDGFGLNATAPSTDCEQCILMINNCSHCLSKSHCTACRDGFYLQNILTCQSCITAISHCLECTSQNVCLLCMDQYQLGPNNASCICAPGFFSITNTCTNITGCISFYIISNIKTCLACDGSKYFSLVNANCICQYGFQLLPTNQFCTEVCGDGIAIIDACDDGNLLRGDGCSKICQVQFGYECLYGSYKSKSLCRKLVNFVVTFQYVMRVIGSNAAKIVFTIQPADQWLQNMDWDTYFQYNITNNGNFAKTEIAFSQEQVKLMDSNTFTYKLGQLTLEVDYSQALEDMYLNMSVSFDPSKFNSPSTSMSFILSGVNAPLTVSNSLNDWSIISRLSLAVGAAALGEFFLSVLVHKMIGLETIQVVQTIFVLRFVGNYDDHSPLVFAMTPLKYSNGYNQPFPDEGRDYYLNRKLTRLDFTKQFFANMMICFGLVLLAWVALAISKLINKKRKNALKNQIAGSRSYVEASKQNQFSLKMTAAIVNHFIFPCSFVMLFQLIFSYYSSMQLQDQRYQLFPRQINVVNLIGVLYFTWFAWKQIYKNFYKYQTIQQKIDKYGIDLVNIYCVSSGYQEQYVSIYFIYYISIAILSMAVSLQEFGLMVILAFQIAYAIVIIKKRPYLIKFHNGAIIFNQIVAIICLAMLICIQKVGFQDHQQYYIFIAILALLFCVEILAFVRLVFHFSKHYEYMKKHVEKIEKRKSLLEEGKKKRLIFEQVNKEEEMDELKRLKKRLKSQLNERGLAAEIEKQ